MQENYDSKIYGIPYIRNLLHINQLLAEGVNENDILVFFTSEVFDVSCRKENRNPLKNNIRAVAQTLSPLQKDIDKHLAVNDKAVIGYHTNRRGMYIKR